MKNVLIVGGSSAIATACARRWAAEGANLFLTGRHEVRLEAVAQDLRVRGAGTVATHILDINDHLQHPAMLDAYRASFERIDIVLIAHGSLPDQAHCERDVGAALRELSTNAISTIALLTLLAAVFESQKSGTIAGDFFRGGGPRPAVELCVRRGESGRRDPSARDCGRGSSNRG